MKEWHEVFSRKLAAFEELKGNPILHSYAATAHALLELIGFENSEKGSWSEGEVAERCHLMRAAFEESQRTKRKAFDGRKFAEDWMRWHEDAAPEQSRAMLLAIENLIAKADQPMTHEADAVAYAAGASNANSLRCKRGHTLNDDMRLYGGCQECWATFGGKPAYVSPAVVTTELGPSPACDCGGPPNHVPGGILCRRKT